MKTIRDFEDADRYVYDCGICSIKKGFAQIDTSQDAWYFGTWANPTKLCIVSYTEGDVTLEQAESPEEFTEAIRNMKRWNEENGHRFLGIDAGLNESIEKAFVDIGLGDLLH